MNNVTVIQHPLVQAKLARLRDERTPSGEFRRLLSDLALLLTYEATRSLDVQSVTVKTPVGRAHGVRLKRETLVVPVLRAGLGMLDSVRQLLPAARVGFIGLRRDEKTLCANAYYQNLPADLKAFEIILIDPMLATGGSALAALELIQSRGGKHIRLVNVIAAPEGIRNVRARHPRLPLFTAAIDQKLNGRGYIVPGLGDAGDRIFSS
ncbi:MAG: uracil phosphoribosyltransferase [Verrucomicrobiota bacterium]